MNGFLLVCKYSLKSPRLDKNIGDLKPKDHYEKNLFSDQNLNLDHLMKVIDQTNNKFGRGAVTVAAARLNNNSKMNRRYSSKIDTSFIKLAPTVRAH